MFCLSWRKAIKGQCHASLRGSKPLERCWSPVALHIIHLPAFCLWFPSLLACCSVCSLIFYSRAAWGLISVLVRVMDLMHDSLFVVHHRWVSREAGNTRHAYCAVQHGSACRCSWWASRLHLKTPQPLHRDLLSASPEEKENEEQRRGSNKESSPLLSSPIIAWLGVFQHHGQQPAGFIVLLILNHPHHPHHVLTNTTRGNDGKIQC